MKLNRWFRNSLVFLMILGPGIITSGVDNDAGGITTYSIIGAHFGMTMLWTLIPITIALIIVQEMCARMGVVTGKGLADLIRENFGLRTTFYLMIVMFVANLGNTLAEFSGVAASLEIFGYTKYISIPICAILIWWLVVKGTYKIVERIFLVACLLYLAYVFSGILAKPHWGEVFKASVIPTFKFEMNWIVALVGMVGTTIAPWMQFYLQSAVVEKGIKLKNYQYSKWDVIIGGFITSIVAFFVIVSCASTIFVKGIHIQSAEDAALALAPLAGRLSSELFAFGLLNASLFAASILPLATAYSICEAMGWELGVNKRISEAPFFYGLYTLLIVLGAGLVLIPRFPLLKVMYFSQVANGVLLPFILIFMLILINKKSLMGGHVNTRLFNIITWLVVLVMILLSMLMVFSMLPIWH